eukprot:ANDGO_02086.mRNA.2 Uncharacterized protein C26H5.04
MLPLTKVKESAVEAVGSFCVHSKEFCDVLSTQEVIMGMLLHVFIDKSLSSNSLRILSCRIFVHMHKHSALSLYPDVERQLYPTLSKLVLFEGPFREPAVVLLAELLSAGAGVIVKEAASESELVMRLCDFVLDKNSSSVVREHSLLAIATLIPALSDTKGHLPEAKLLTRVVELLSGSNADLRRAACVFVRCMSRSVRQLRTSLVDAGVAGPLLSLLDDPRESVRIGASSALCNLVIDVSPMKQLLVQRGILDKFVRFLQDPIPEMRLNGLSGIGNALFSASATLRPLIISIVPWSVLRPFLESTDPKEQEKALVIVRNMLCGSRKEIWDVLQSFSETSLLPTLLASLQSPSESVVIQACFAIGNVAAGDCAALNAELLSEETLQRLANVIEHPNPEVCLAGLWVITNMMWDSNVADRKRKQDQVRKHQPIADSIAHQMLHRNLEIRYRATAASSILAEFRSPS